MRGARPARLLTIAGSDSGGGAGIQADLKTFAAHRAYGMSVITAVTAQNTLQVRAVHEVPAAIVAAQIDAVFDDIGVDAVKVGMLGNAEVVAAVAERLEAWKGPPVVLDPVMVAKSGASLLAPQAVEVLRTRLLPLARLVTPNLPEGVRLTGLGVATEEERRRLCRALSEAGAAVLLKGGHGEGDEVVDLLFEGGRFRRFAHPRLRTRALHGTGCTLSAAIAARLGQGESLESAVEGAINYLQGAMAAAYPLGAGHGPVNHIHARP